MKALCVITFFATSVTAWGSGLIKELPLDDGVVYTLSIPHKAGVTTVMFPGEVSHLSSSNIVPEGHSGGDFVLAYQPGSYFFQLRANHWRAHSILNVIYQGKTYLLELKAAKKAHHAITFYEPRRLGGKNPTVTPSQLLVILDKAKAYTELRQHHPEAVTQVDYHRPRRIMLYEGFQVLVDEVFRFEAQDTLVFKVILRNQTDQPIAYRSDRFAVRVGHHIYYQSLSDASGVMPPQSDSLAYFTITGTADGGRNWLHVKNKWNVLVVRKAPVLPFQDTEEHKVKIQTEEAS